MLEKDDYIVITKAQNGFLVSVNNDESDDDKEIHVFNRQNDLLNHIGDILKGELVENQSVADCMTGLPQ